MSTKNLIIVVASAFGLVGLVYWLTQRNKTAEVSNPSLVDPALGVEDPDLGSTSPSCITVPTGLTPWSDTAWYDHDGVDGYMKGRVENRYREFNLPSKDAATQYGIGFFKAIGLKPTLSNVKKYENELIAYLKSDDKFPHWDETVGRRRC